MTNPQQEPTFTERIETTGGELLERVKGLAKDANAKRVLIKDQDGKELVAVPLGWGVAGGALAVIAAPVLAAVAAIGGAMANVQLEVERVGEAPTATDGPQDPAAGDATWTQSPTTDV